jgi:hypothetical protein
MIASLILTREIICLNSTCLHLFIKLLKTATVEAYKSDLDPHVSFDRTDCLAGCEERWGPDGREVDGRRVIFMGPLDGSDPSWEETCDRWN